MKVSVSFLGALLMATGFVYLAKPDIFRRWFWMRTSIAIRLLSEAGYRRYMRVLGVLQILGGLGVIIWDMVRRVRAP
jgi:hypothetical protein